MLHILQEMYNKSSQNIISLYTESIGYYFAIYRIEFISQNTKSIVGYFAKYKGHISHNTRQTRKYFANYKKKILRKIQIWIEIISQNTGKNISQKFRKIQHFAKYNKPARMPISQP